VQRTVAIVALLAACAVAAGCGGDDAPPPPGSAPVAVEDGAEHIHGIGVNPADGSLIIATHTGLFRAPPGEQRPQRIGEGRQDTMGFTVVGPDRFLGSGHPDPRENLPPLLGLIRSDDAGRNWQSVSLLGQADFHVLRASGRTIYGVNATDGRLLVSADGGRRWEPRQTPAPLVDLAPHPRRPQQVLASAQDALYLSRDAGRTWRPVARGRAGLLTWLADGSVYLVDAAGAVHRSADAGGSWEALSEVGGQPAALSSHGAELYVALHTNEVKVSENGGRSWRARVIA
jgi:photosystem II stability/assembly factor-like uncharacterized protein